MTFLYNTNKNMSVQKIGVREFLRNFKAISEKTNQNIVFIVEKNSRPLFKVSPIKEDKKKKYNWADLDKFIFKGKGGKNLSKNVDKIVYNI